MTSFKHNEQCYFGEQTRCLSLSDLRQVIVLQAQYQVPRYNELSFQQTKGYSTIHHSSHISSVRQYFLTEFYSSNSRSDGSSKLEIRRQRILYECNKKVMIGTRSLRLVIVKQILLIISNKIIKQIEFRNDKCSQCCT